MNKITIRTNNHWRELLHGFELDPKHRSEFDYLSDDEYESQNFIKYQDIVYSLDQFMRTDCLPQDNPLSKWGGYLSDSFFSGVVIRFSDDLERVQVGTFFS